MRRQLHRHLLAEEPHLRWNAFIDLLAVESYADLDPSQRPAHLVFWYESEVQNGGHGQYFENQGVGRIEEVLAALSQFGLSEHASVLRSAVQAFRRGDAARLSLADTEFHACSDSIVQVLHRHLDESASNYVELV